VSTSCTSSSDFLVSISPQVGALLSAIALWVASRARSTSKVALQTSREAKATSRGPYVGPHVVVSPVVAEGLRRRSSTTPDPDDTSTSRGDDD
jgi:hypothetical protein